MSHKNKIKSSVKKRFRLTGTGKVRFLSAYLRHNTSKRPGDMKRQNRGTQILSPSDQKIVRKKFLFL